MAETAAQRRQREADEASAEQADGNDGPAEAAGEPQGAPEGDGGTDGADEPTEAATGDQGAESAAVADGEVREYRASRSMDGVKAGRTFLATADDPRVKSGFAKLVPVAEVPDTVAEALDGASSQPS